MAKKWEVFLDFFFGWRHCLNCDCIYNAKWSEEMIYMGSNGPSSAKICSRCLGNPQRLNPRVVVEKLKHEKKLPEADIFTIEGAILKRMRKVLKFSSRAA